MFLTRILPVSLLSALFVLALGYFLPDQVTSHFDAKGSPTGVISQTSFVILMLFCVSLLPALLWLLAARLIRVCDASLINVPNREVWLSPEHIEETRAYLVRHFAYFCQVLVAFLCYAFALVALACRPPSGSLADSALLAGAAVFFVSLGVWGWRLHAHFSRTQN